MLRKLYKKLNKKFGVKIFKNPNTINYNLFNIFYDRFIQKKINISYIEEFNKNGYFKVKDASSNLVELINDRIIRPQEKNINPNSKKHRFYVPEEIREEIIKQISRNYNDVLKNLEVFYNNKISICEIVVRRNYPLENSEYYKNKIRTKEMEIYNNYYHVDFYVSAFFKMFINLTDVYEENGPLHIYDINSTEDYIKKYNYSSRLDYETKEIKEKLKINTGKKGEGLIANTTKCLHRAGIVKKNHRDILFVIFGLIPKKTSTSTTYENLNYFNTLNEDALWNHSGQFTKIYKKKNIRETINLFNNFNKNKIN